MRFKKAPLRSTGKMETIDKTTAKAKNTNKGDFTYSANLELSPRSTQKELDASFRHSNHIINIKEEREEVRLKEMEVGASYDFGNSFVVMQLFLHTHIFAPHCTVCRQLVNPTLRIWFYVTFFSTLIQ